MDPDRLELTSGAEMRRMYWPTMRRAVGLTRKYRLALYSSIVLAVIAQGFTIAIPWATGRVVDEAIEPRDAIALRNLILLILGLAVLRLIVMFLRRLIAGTMAIDIEQDLRNMLYAHLLTLSFPFFDRNQTGQIMSRATVDLGTLRIFLGYGILFFTQHTVTVVAVLAVLFYVNWIIALIVLAIVPPLALLAVRYSRVSQPVVAEGQQALGHVTTQAEESIVGVRVIKAFGQEKTETRRFRERAEDVFGWNIKATRQRALYVPLMDFLPTIALAGFISIGGAMVISGRMSLGDFVAVSLLVTLIVMPLRMLGMWVGEAQRFVASSIRVFAIMDARAEIVDPPDPQPLPADGRGHVAFRSVTFGYDTDRPILHDVDLEIDPGSTVAIIGRTGSGKTTLTQLIPRFYDVQRGAVEVDGIDVRAADLDLLRAEIGIVAEDTYLFSASIRENIAFGRPEATLEEIKLAAERAQAAGFIEELADGYETLVGERGLTLSGGQRQRIAIARTLLLDPRVLILDDATASVDASTEARIRAALEEVMQGRTTLIIAHRLSTIALADRIVVIDGGRIVADGDHATLIATNDVYREIHDHGLVERRFVNADGDHVVVPVGPDHQEEA